MIQIPDNNTDSNGDGYPDDQAGRLASPGYPYVLPYAQDCRWNIRAPAGNVMHLNTLLFIKKFRGHKSFSWGH